MSKLSPGMVMHLYKLHDVTSKRTVSLMLTCVRASDFDEFLVPEWTFSVCNLCSCYQAWNAAILYRWWRRKSRADEIS